MNDAPTLFDVVYNDEGHKIIGPSVMDMITTPLLPYNGTSGWSGSTTSEARAQTDDSDGTTGQRQRDAFAIVHEAQTNGVTWRELADRLGLHHGSASGVLSVLHKAGLIRRLTEQRQRCQVYVAPGFVAGRSEAPYKPNVGQRVLIDLLTDLARDLDAGQVTVARARIGATLNNLTSN